jgi:hypothetical protein
VQVGGGISGVVEVPAETFLERLQLGNSFEVALTVPHNHFVEEAQMAGNGISDLPVRRRNEVHPSAALAFRPQPLQNVETVWQGACIDMRRLCEPAFHSRTTLQEPVWQPKKHPRRPLDCAD